MSQKHSFHIHNKQYLYVLQDIFMQFVAVKTKIWWNNKGSSFFYETRCSSWCTEQWAASATCWIMCRHKQTPEMSCAVAC